MTMQTDVLAVSLAASGDISTARTRVRGLVVEPGASAGSLVFKNGGSGGTTLFTINTIAGGQAFPVVIPAEGVLFTSGAYVALTNAKVTVFYA